MITRYLNKEHIIAIHAELIDQFGGLHGIRDESLLESAVGRYQSGYYGNVIEEAAALMESLGINHPFLDGNKRIAVTAPLVFLMANGYTVSLDEDEAFKFIIRALEQGSFNKDHLMKWIGDNAKPMQNSAKQFSK
jgi:death-on-curing protein